MQSICYHVAVTLDGFIAKPDHSWPGFPITGPHVEAYRAKLSRYAAVVMGRRTYEVGYDYGMQPGDLPYGERPHHVFSRTIELPSRPHLHVESGDTLARIDEIRRAAQGEIYLCGGGKFAGYLLSHGRIDNLRLKLAPIVYGRGISLFEGFDGMLEWDLVGETNFGNGHLLLEYRRS